MQRKSEFGISIFIFNMILLIILLTTCSGCETMRSSKKTHIKNPAEDSDSRALHLKENCLMKIAECIGFYNGKLASREAEIQEITRIYEDRKKFWSEVKDVCSTEKSALSEDIIEMLIRNDQKLTRFLVETILKNNENRKSVFQENVLPLQQDITDLHELIDKKDAGIYLLGWEIERLRGLLSQSGIDMEKDSYMESLSVDDIVRGLSREELLARLEKLKNVNPDSKKSQTELVMSEHDIVKNAGEGSYENVQAIVPLDQLNEKERVEAALTDTAPGDASKDSDEALYKTASNLINTYQYKMAYDLILSSFESEIPERFMELLEKAASEDIAQKRKESANLFLKARELESTRAQESLSLMKESAAILEELIKEYPDNQRIPIVESNKRSILKRISELESDLSKNVEKR